MAKLSTLREHTLVLDDDEANVLYEALAFLISEGDLAKHDGNGKAISLRDTLGIELDPHRYH